MLLVNVERKNRHANAPADVPEIVTPHEAAAWLRVTVSTFYNWVSEGKFTNADGLRHVGGASRVHFPTLRQRTLEGELMSGAFSRRRRKLNRRKLEVVATPLAGAIARLAVHHLLWGAPLGAHAALRILA